MKTNDFLDTIKQSGISYHEKFMMQLLRPSIDIIRNKDKHQSIGCSRFGGSPDLPVGVEWPRYNNKAYRFLGQINFSEIRDIETDLPKSGLLCLFFDDYSDDEENLEAWEDGYIHAIFTPNFTNLRTIEESDLTHGKEVVIEFAQTMDIPYDEYQVKEWPLDEDETMIYDEIRENLHRSDDYLLGYPSHRTLAYNPTPGEEWISLLTIDSDDGLEWCWHDFDKLMIFIKREDLKNANFSNLKAVTG